MGSYCCATSPIPHSSRWLALNEVPAEPLPAVEGTGPSPYVATSGEGVMCAVHNTLSVYSFISCARSICRGRGAPATDIEKMIWTHLDETGEMRYPVWWRHHSANRQEAFPHARQYTLYSRNSQDADGPIATRLSRRGLAPGTARFGLVERQPWRISWTTVWLLLYGDNRKHRSPPAGFRCFIQTVLPVSRQGHATLPRLT